MQPLIFSLYQHSLAHSLAQAMNCEMGKINFRNFPDNETYLQLQSSVKDRDLIVVDSLDNPNKKIMPLIYFCETAKELGAKRVDLISPYLAYMRQDKRFNPDEAVTSRIFAELISGYFDSITTIDPHLHRYHDLSEIYSIPSKVLHTTEIISNWIQMNMEKPLLMGPDMESEQWVADIAKNISSPWVILQKKRMGDEKVIITMPDISEFSEYTPILIDDIISTGRTMLEAVTELRKIHTNKPHILAVHGIFSGDAYEKLLNSGLAGIATSNTITHRSNAIDILPLLMAAVTGK